MDSFVTVDYYRELQENFMQTVRFWQERLCRIYPNDGDAITPDYMMAHLYTACSQLCRFILRNEHNPARDAYVIKAITWMIALSNHFKIDLEDCYLNRFPNACTYCLYAPCRCDQTGKRPIDHRGVAMSAEEAILELQMKRQAAGTGQPLSFTNLIRKINTIYPGNRTLLMRNGQAYVAGKMLEEGGEVHRSYSAYFRGAGAMKRIGEELSDLSGWVLSCWDIENGTKNLDAELAHLYVVGCPTCKSEPCVCPPYSITRDQEEAIRTIIDQLRAVKTAGLKDVSVDNALIDAEDAVADPSPTKNRKLVKSLQKAMKSVKGANDTIGAGVGIFEKLNSAYDFLEGFL